MFDSGNILFAFGLTLFAGLSTGIGSALAFFTKRTNTRFLSVALGFSAGVMIYVSMIEIFGKAKIALTSAMGIEIGTWVTVISFFAGMILIAVIDKLIPSGQNPHETRKVEEISGEPLGNQLKTKTEAVVTQIVDTGTVKVFDQRSHSLLRMGLFMALVIAIHNFPEGLATFVSALNDPHMGVVIAVAIAIHNIPEGIAVAIPVYYATGSRRRAFGLSLLSGVLEPVGAVVGYFILRPFMNETVFGILFASVAGIMVFISLDELLPTAREYGEHHLAIYGLVIGMMVMALSLLLMM